MPVADEEDIKGSQGGSQRRLWPRRWRSRIALGVAAAALIASSTAWISREQVARDVIEDYLAQNGIPATFDITAIGPRIQVIENLVIGDPKRPDLTARRVVVELGVGWAGPEVRRITVEGARLFAQARGGSFTLGTLDPLIFTDSDAPSALPAIDVVIRDGRALVESDYGAVGVMLDGAGRLDDGFAGTLAATAPGIGTPDCRAETATLYGKLTITRGAPQLDGPLRLSGLVCEGAQLAKADIGTVLSLTRDFTAAEANLKITGERAAYAAMTGAGLSGTARFNWTPERLALAHDLALSEVITPHARLARLSAEGSWRAAADGQSGAWEGTLRGAGLDPGDDRTTSLAAAERGLEGTLLAPLLAKARGGLDRALTGASLRADAIIRHKGSDIALIIPDAGLTARSGTRVLALSQVSARLGPKGLAGLSGNILAGGEGLPVLNGRMAQQQGGGWELRAALSEYAAGANRIAIPRLTLRQDADGMLRFDGLATASGDLPGGGVRDLTVPIDGTWSAARGLAIGTRCLPLRFASLALSGLTLGAQELTLCPDSAGPMLTYRDALSFAARTGPVSLAGQLSESPATFTADSVVLRYPQPFAVQGLAARIGRGDSEVRLNAASLTGSLAGDITGAFEGGTAQLAAVPLDLDRLTGRWAYDDGVLRVSEGAFTLTDRPVEGAARFKPLVAQGATLLFDGAAFTAEAALRHPASGSTVGAVSIVHRLEDAAGSARITVPGVTFNKSLQPEDLSELAKGVVALAEGTVTGSGQINWTADDISSSGTFGSQGLDFAAAFGPVRGLAGDVRFTDLLNLTTAPDQRVTIAAINPGVEVLAGTVQFELKDGTQLSLEEATFPFMGGILLMQPLKMDFGQPEERRYVFEIIGLDAATFVAQMELTNIGATGTFDGTVPIIFDTNGFGRIEGGLLLSRPGGGNVAYIGDLTYEDLGAMGNYAFEALRSLDYRDMRIGLSGNLAGEIITNFDFDGVRQGQGASQNFITRRFAKLPIQFKINVRSETFSQLALIVRGYSDPTVWVDENLVRIENGKLILRGGEPAVPPASPLAIPPQPQTVQPPESDALP